MSSRHKVNLLPKDEFEYSNLGKFIKWAVSVGRWIVVITEFIVICAFLSRFYFDTVLANLFDETKQKQAMIDSATSFENNFRQIQKKLKVVKDILAQRETPSTLMAEINQKIPSTVTLTGITITKDKLNLSGYSLSEGGLQTFFSGLSNHPKLSKVTLTNISSANEGFLVINFNITALIKK